MIKLIKNVSIKEKKIYFSFPSTFRFFKYYFQKNIRASFFLLFSLIYFPFFSFQFIILPRFLKQTEKQ